MEIARHSVTSRPEAYAEVTRARAEDHRSALRESDSLVPITQVDPRLEEHQELISRTDHLMQLIGNPVRTLISASQNPNNISIETASFLYPNDLAISRQNLIEQRNHVRSAATLLLRLRDDYPEECAVASAAFHHVETAFDRAFELLENQETLLQEYTHALDDVSVTLDSFSTSIRPLRAAHQERRAQAAASTNSEVPGAYLISAEEAASEGSFHYFEPRPPLEPVEAAPLHLPIGHLTPIPDGGPALRLLKKAPYSPDRLPMVVAEPPMIMPQGLPTAEATIITQKEQQTDH